MTEQLLHHIQRLLPGVTLPQEQMALFFETGMVRKGELLLREHEPCDRIYFVNKGCLYLFYEHNGEQQIVHFALENWWLTDYKTFADNAPAVYAIAAMEDAVLTSMSRKNYEALLQQFPFMALYFNKIHERAYGAALYKQQTFATVSKPDFYKYFRDTYPALMQRIPDDIFAAYMGVSLAVLQAIREACVS